MLGNWRVPLFVYPGASHLAVVTSPVASQARPVAGHGDVPGRAGGGWAHGSRNALGMGGRVARGVGRCAAGRAVARAGDCRHATGDGPMSAVCASGHQPQAEWTFLRREGAVVWLGFVCRHCPAVLWREATAAEAAEVHVCRAK